MKIITDNSVEIEVRIKETLNERVGYGWPILKLQPEVFIDNKRYFIGTEVDATGCSHARANAQYKMHKECFTWILDKGIYWGGTGLIVGIEPI